MAGAWGSGEEHVSFEEFQGFSGEFLGILAGFRVPQVFTEVFPGIARSSRAVSGSFRGIPVCFTVFQGHFGVAQRVFEGNLNCFRSFLMLLVERTWCG